MGGFVSAEVADAAEVTAVDAALVGGGAGCALLDGGTVLREGVGEGGAAVVL